MATKDFRNICKFVPSDTPSSLTASTFIYENKAPERGQTRVYPRNTMYLVISGNGLFSSALGDYPLNAGTVFFSFDSMPYRIDNTDALRYMYIDFDGPRAQALFERFFISPAHCIFRGYEGLIPFWQDSLSIANEQNLDLVCESVLLYSFSRLSNTIERSEDHLIGDVLQHIQNHLSDSNLSLASIAEDLGYNPKYISTIFTGRMGVTYSDYVKNLRIRHAVFLMEQGIVAVKNVAFLSGFRDPLYFSKVFRQSIGISPSDYIEQLRRAESPKET
jgi:AraC-like DNA-binding protein